MPARRTDGEIALPLPFPPAAGGEAARETEGEDGGERLEEGGAERERLEEGFAAALEAIDAARRREAESEALHPAARKVLATLGREWEGLARHRQFPELPLDNNAAERALRAAVVGRKNYYGSGSAWAAAAAGRIWTVTASAARAGCNPLSYLVAYLEACAREGGRAPAGEALARFFPWALAAADAAAWREAPLEPPSGPAP